MIKNFIRIAIRNLFNQKVYSLINIVGLAIGMAACVVILLYIQQELSYENMHPDADRIYRVLTIDKALGTNNQRVGITMPALGPVLPEALPEVSAATRLTSGQKTLLTTQDQNSVFANSIRAADSNFFQFFNYKLLLGDPETALAEPYSLILTESLARQLFNDPQTAFQNVVTSGNGVEFRITGILEDLPENTHLDFDALGAIASIVSEFMRTQPPDSNAPPWVEIWPLIAMPTYVKLNEGAVLDSLDEKITQITRDHNVLENFVITLQPLLDVHLKSTDIIFDPVTNKGDLNDVYVFGAIALLILLIATVNYVNLSTARSAQRAKEVGLRKVVGSRRSQLIGQFLCESLVLAFLALILAIVLVGLFLPWINNIGNTSLVFDLMGNPLLLVFLVVLITVPGILAGLYPASVLANFTPIKVLKGSFVSSRKGTGLRRALVVVQFSLSISLIAVTGIIQQQLHYIQHKDLGYDREQVLLLDMFDRAMGQQVELLSEELRQHQAFSSVATGGNVPGRTFGRTVVRPEGVPDEDIWIWSVLSVNPDYLTTLGMEIAEGRNFNRELATDSNAVMINETAVRQLSWEDPLTRHLFFGNQDSVGTPIIGVVKDFHFAGLHQLIEPVVVYPLGSRNGNIIAARINPGQISTALEFAALKWKEVFPDHPFIYTFLDEEFEKHYRRDVNTGKIVNIFSGLAIFIACLGLLGLSSHATMLRTKEIGVRKVMGASTVTIVRLLVTDFIKWVLLANVFALPLAFFAADRWLQNFAYRIEIGWVTFLLAICLSTVIAVLTVMFQTLKAASSKPIKCLRYE